MLPKDDILHTHALFPQPNGVRLQNCAGIWELVKISVEMICYHALFKVAGYDDGGCESESQCSMCNFVHPPRATLRGLCTNRWIIWDWKYYLTFFSVGSMSFTHFVGIPHAFLQGVPQDNRQLRRDFWSLDAHLWRWLCDWKEPRSNWNCNGNGADGVDLWASSLPIFTSRKS